MLLPTQVTRHWLGLLRGGLLSNQALAMAALNAFLPPGGGAAGGPGAEQMATAVAQYLAEEPAAGKDIVTQLAHSHPHSDAAEDGAAGGGCAFTLRNPYRALRSMWT